MPNKISPISGKDLIRHLQKIGYRQVRQKGSHVRLRHNDITRKPITVPLHKEIKAGLLHQILKDANLSISQLFNL